MLFEKVLDLELVVELVEFQGVDSRPESAAEWSDSEYWPILRGFWCEAAAEGVVHDLLERHVQQLRPLLEGVGEVVVKGEGGSHVSIKASLSGDVKVFGWPTPTISALACTASSPKPADEVAKAGEGIPIVWRGRLTACCCGQRVWRAPTHAAATLATLS